MYVCVCMCVLFLLESKCGHGCGSLLSLCLPLLSLSLFLLDFLPFLFHFHSPLFSSPSLSLSLPHSISNPPSLQQLHCFTAACGYDGGDGSCSFTNTTDAWSQCPYPECRTNYNNDVCDQKCNNAPCLYDGRDCTFLLPTCPAE